MALSENSTEAAFSRGFPENDKFGPGRRHALRLE
jgi:hypothetical protein